MAMDIGRIRDRVDLRKATENPVLPELRPDTSLLATAGSVASEASLGDVASVSGVKGCPFGPRLNSKTRALSVQGKAGAEMAACQAPIGPSGAPLGQQLAELRKGICPFLSQQLQQMGSSNPQLESLMNQLRSGELDSVQFFEQMRQSVGPSFQVGQARLETRPLVVQQIMATTETNFSKSPLQLQAIDPNYGSDNIFVAGQQQWKERRTLLSPFFDTRHVLVDSTHNAITQKVTQHLDRWQSSSEPVDLAREMPKLTLDSALGHMFGVHLSDAELGQAVELFQASGRAVGDRLIGRNESASPELEPGLEKLAQRLLQGRQSTAQLQSQGLAIPDDMMQVLVDRFGDSPQELHKEVLSLALLGHETTANLINWTLAELEQHPAVLQSMRQEVDQVVGQQGPPNLETVRELKSPRLNLSETWRLHPPNNLMLREALKDLDLDDGQGGKVHIAKGTQVMMPLSVVNQESVLDGELWQPDRGGSKVFSFGGGQRVCMGQVFARHEAAVILTEMVRRFDFQSVDPNLTPHTGFATGPEQAVYHLTPRRSARGSGPTD